MTLEKIEWVQDQATDLAESIDDLVEQFRFEGEYDKDVLAALRLEAAHLRLFAKTL